LPFLTKLFDENKIAYETHTTKKIMDGYEITKKICAENADCSGIIGIGGDGTFQEIAAGMAISCGEKIPVPLAIFPAGSGNDFIMTLAGGKKAALAKYGKNAEQNSRAFFETLMRNEKRAVDVITANGAAFLNIGNLGIDVRIVQNAAVFKQKFGRQAYLAAVYKSIVRHSNIPLEIEVDGKKIENSYTLVAVCNGQYYGGGMRVSPRAQIDDGKITLCLVEAMSRAKIMVLFPSLMFEKHERLKQVKYMKCENVRITFPQGTETLCLDGNLYENNDSTIEFKISPKALEVFV
jgi:diacylglycerol kinase family enzyme